MFPMRHYYNPKVISYKNLKQREIIKHLQQRTLHFMIFHIKKTQLLRVLGAQATLRTFEKYKRTPRDSRPRQAKPLQE